MSSRVYFPLFTLPISRTQTDTISVFKVTKRTNPFKLRQLFHEA